MDAPVQPLVSVVTPIYNGEKYLAECIESVLSQTYQHWEYIIANNCSTDRSLEIAQSYADKDARIRIHNNRTFVGAMENHNIALQLVSPESEYCKILHADDWLFPECLVRMVTVAEAHPSVSIVGAYGLRGNGVMWDGLPYTRTVVSGREVCQRTLLEEGFNVFGTQTSHLIRSDLIRSRKEFYNTHELYGQYADQEVCYKALQDSDFGFVHQVLTYSRVHPESLTASFLRTGLNTDILSQLIILTQYGPIYLSDAEYQRCLRRTIRRYYIFLSQNIFLWRSRRRFWSYQKRALDYIGHPLSIIKLLEMLPLGILPPEGINIILNMRDICRNSATNILKIING
jgi:glycosyltransferase involved in cell wall biosynthesis